jgi:Tol biopolymer transport system component
MAERSLDLPRGTLERVGWAWWTPDGRRVIFQGREKDRAWRAYIQEPPDGQPQPISPEGTRCGTPGYEWMQCCHDQEGEGRRIRICELGSVEGGKKRPAPWLGQEEDVIAWSPDGRHAFVTGRTQPPFRVFRVDVATGRREPWLDTSPPDPTGVDTLGSTGAVLTPNGRHYAYAYLRTLSDLFLVEGLR